MNNDNEWLKGIISDEEMAEIESKAKRIVDAHGVYYEMSVMMSQQDMIDAVRAGYFMRMGDKQAWMLGISVLMSLLGTMEIALEEDGVDLFPEDEINDSQ